MAWAHGGFWTLDIDYRSTYCMARFPAPHSFIGIQPARTGAKIHHTDQAVGINHVALWAQSRNEVDRLHHEFLIPRGIRVTDDPQEYPHYWPGYYAVFFDDPINGIHWELARLPKIPSARQIWRSYRAVRRIGSERPKLPNSVPGLARLARRTLPSRQPTCSQAESVPAGPVQVDITTLNAPNIIDTCPGT